MGTRQKPARRYCARRQRVGPGARPPQDISRTASPKNEFESPHREPVETNRGQGISPHRLKSEKNTRTGYRSQDLSKTKSKNQESPSLKDEKKRGRGYSPHRTSSATKQEDRVLGPYLPTKKALTSAATLHKDHQNATKSLLVPAPRKSPGATPVKRIYWCPSHDSSGNSQNTKGRKVFDQRVPLRRQQRIERDKRKGDGGGTQRVPERTK